MKIIVGLGNVGEKYEKTRHNAGFILIETLSHPFVNLLGVGSESGWKRNSKTKCEENILTLKTGVKVLLAKPQTMMNLSGEAVFSLLSYYKIKSENLLVAHDDLDLLLGATKFQRGKGPKAHNGILSIESKLKDDSFWRLRIGVDARDVENRQKGEEYVLQTFSSQELSSLISALSDAVADKVTFWVRGDFKESDK